ncbi:MAG: hypothetical protein OXD44_09420 [Gammaproteobacteria bacterium]|nr:hypothetical protein [Gammaproteobacteria bacterium]
MHDIEFEGCFKKVNYADLRPRQKENYNFQKVAARLADYGFNCLRLSDDWQGADFIACHIDNKTFLKVQLKGRLVVDKKYCQKEIFIAFCNGDDYYVYPHDEFLKGWLNKRQLGKRGSTKGWKEKGAYSWKNPPKWALNMLSTCKI